MKTAQKGFIAILTVIALLAFSLSLVAAVTYLSIDESQSGLVLAKGQAAFQLAAGCAEDALLLASRDAEYAGGTYGYLDGTCTVDVAKDGTAWELVVTGQKDAFGRGIRIAIERVPTEIDPDTEEALCIIETVPTACVSPVTLSSWLEQ